MSVQPALIGGLRCLQEGNGRERGIGRHAPGLLQHAMAHGRLAAGHRIMGITDSGPPALGGTVRALAGSEQDTGHVGDTAGCRFAQLSPMTHDPLFAARLSSSPRCAATAARGEAELAGVTITVTNR